MCRPTALGRTVARYLLPPAVDLLDPGLVIPLDFHPQIGPSPPFSNPYWRATSSLHRKELQQKIHPAQCSECPFTDPHRWEALLMSAPALPESICGREHPCSDSGVITLSDKSQSSSLARHHRTHTRDFPHNFQKQDCEPRLVIRVADILEYKSNQCQDSRRRPTSPKSNCLSNLLRLPQMSIMFTMVILTRKRYSSGTMTHLKALRWTLRQIMVAWFLFQCVVFLGVWWICNLLPHSLFTCLTCLGTSRLKHIPHV